MNYVERAKRLIMQTARTTALVIVPLAVAVPAVQAGSVSLPVSGTPTCSFQQSGSLTTTDCSSSVIDSVLSGSGVDGVRFSSTSGGISFPSLIPGGADAVQLVDSGT